MPSDGFSVEAIADNNRRDVKPVRLCRMKQCQRVVAVRVGFTVCLLLLGRAGGADGAVAGGRVRLLFVMEAG